MKILYFASLREALNLSEEEFIITTQTTVEALKQSLIKQHGQQYFPNNILCAVNQQLVQNDNLINNDDEVAFYPPVTGG